MAHLKTAKTGDRVVFKRADGLYDIENVVAPGELKKVRQGINTWNQAREIALGHKSDGAKLWVRHHGTPDEIEP